MSVDAVHQTISKNMRRAPVEDFEDLVKAAESSGTKVLKMIPTINVAQVEDGFSCRRLAALASDGEWPYLANFRVVQVRRDSEDLLVRTDLTRTTRKVYSGLTKTTFSAEVLLLRKKCAGNEKSKRPVTAGAAHRCTQTRGRTFWEELGRGAKGSASSSSHRATAEKRGRHD